MNRVICALLLLPCLPGPPARADTLPPAPAQPTPNPLPRVVVTGTRESEDSYRVPALDSIGPLGSTPILDTPYAIAILPGEIIENSQAINFKDVSKYLPLVAYQEQQGPDILRPMTRGMQGGNFQNTKIDGMTTFITVATAMEQFQQLEVVNGLSAFLYGPANPSGMFNFISKRPTDTALHEVWASYANDSIGTVKADFGGRIDPGGVLGYRFNALYGSGDAYVDHSHQRRAMGDLGIDVRPFEHGVLELNYSDYSLTNKGYPGWFTYGEKVQLPAAPDPNTVGYGQPYAGVDLRTRIASARLRQDLSSNWHLVVGVLNQDAARNINTPVNNLAKDGSYVSSFANGFAPRFVIVSDTAYLNGTFTTLGVSHDLTFGTAGYQAASYSVTTPATPAGVRLGAASLEDPMVFPEPVGGAPNVLANFISSNTYQQGLNVGDTLRFSEHWATRVGVSQDWFHVNNFNAKGKQVSRYKNGGSSPTASLVFNPVATQTAYFTWASSLQAGDLAPGTAANAGVSLAPYRSREYELGYKASLAKIDLTAALFRIQRPFANLDPSDNVFKISGEQVNRGLELSAIGRASDSLTLFGGVTFLDAFMQHTPLLSTNDKRYVGTARVKGNVLLEYQLPHLTGLVASFDYQFSGDRPGNDTNTFTVSGYNLFDVGVRYSSALLGKRTTLRLAVDNLTDRHYWSTISPSNLTGANTGNLIAHLGAPRTILASINVEL